VINVLFVNCRGHERRSQSSHEKVKKISILATEDVYLRHYCNWEDSYRLGKAWLHVLLHNPHKLTFFDQWVNAFPTGHLQVFHQDNLFSAVFMTSGFWEGVSVATFYNPVSYESSPVFISFHDHGEGTLLVSVVVLYQVPDSHTLKVATVFARCFGSLHSSVWPSS
jgi:hypothetical protein